MSDETPQIDAASTGWTTTERVIRHEIEKARDALETSNLPLDQTENLRGQIVALRNLIRAATPNLPMEGMPLSYDVIRQPS